MPAIPKVYKSTDGNAPVMCGIMGSVVNILRKCLVDGYGDKEPAGWTMPYINVEGTKAAFRSNPENGTGFWLSVNHGDPANPYYYYCNGYEMMTSEVDGTGYFSGNARMQSSKTADATARPWILIATDTWVYFFGYQAGTTFPTTSEIAWSTSNALSTQFFFGDFEKFYPDDHYNCGLFLSSASSNNNKSAFGKACDLGDITLPHHAIARAISGAVGQIGCTISVGPPCNGDCYLGGLGAPYTGISGLIVSKAFINNGEQYSLRGCLPGVLVPLHPSPFENISTVSVNGDDYLAVSFRNAIDSGFVGVNTSSQLLFYIGPTP